MGAAPAGFPFSSHDDWGYYVDAGHMVVPERPEPVVRVSTVQGDQRVSWECAAGLDHDVDGRHQNKFTFDVTVLVGSPTSKSGSVTATDMTAS
ncbi:MAG: hypothetical protein IPM29_27075 [Planctomycetes bacterium]|nr:hypothetical protein [Planctomycetota bacterium]